MGKGLGPVGALSICRLAIDSLIHWTVAFDGYKKVFGIGLVTKAKTCLYQWAWGVDGLPLNGGFEAWFGLLVHTGIVANSSRKTQMTVLVRKNKHLIVTSILFVGCIYLGA